MFDIQREKFNGQHDDHVDMLVTSLKALSLVGRGIYWHIFANILRTFRVNISGFLISKENLHIYNINI